MQHISDLPNDRPSAPPPAVRSTLPAPPPASPPAPLRSAPPPARGTSMPIRPPFTRHDLDRAAPWLRLLVGVVFIGGGAVATVMGVRADLAPLFARYPTLFGVPAYLVVGLAAATLISGGEWIASERMRLFYGALLLIDARYNQMQLGPWIDDLAAYHLRGAAPEVAHAVGLLVSWGISLAVARFGEVLLFGQRRT